MAGESEFGFVVVNDVWPSRARNGMQELRS